MICERNANWQSSFAQNERFVDSNSTARTLSSYANWISTPASTRMTNAGSSPAEDAKKFD